jgi:hypothetical protein
MWSLTYDPSTPPQHIFTWRVSHDIQHAPEILVLYSGQRTSSYSIVNAHTGQEVKDGSLAYPVEQVVQLPQSLPEGTTEQRLYVLITPGAQPQAHLLPDTPNSRNFVAALRQDLYFWQADRATGILKGFHIDKRTLAVSQLWSNVYGSSGTSVLAVAPPVTYTADPPTPAKVLGDRSLKIKYINRNSVFVATGPPDGTSSQALDSSEVQLTVQVVDTVTGRPIYRQTLKGARGPVHAVYCENWVVYHYFSVLNHRWEITVLELYDTALDNLQMQDLMFGSVNMTLSSFETSKIEVLKQSYFINTGIKTLDVTATSYGITNRLLLLGTIQDQVYLMDKKFLDPRRPLGKPTEADQLEQLIPYHDTLPIMPTQYATHNKRVAHLKGTATAPAKLESTALLLVHGLDLFLTRIQPSKAFDSLSDDFPYAFLVLITAALLGGCFVLKFWDDRESIKRKWE